MKKYLMSATAAMALAFVAISCSRDTISFDPNLAHKKLTQTYNQSFENIIGTPNPSQTWGFGEPAGARATRAGNPGENHNSTSTGINANANEWADPNKYFGGWVVPDPLTEEQKNVVKAYFQAVPNLTYEDPMWRHFFVQQVYKGGTAPGNTGNKEKNTDANGTEYSSNNMNLLTVGYNEQHINNFNAGSYSGQAIQVDGQTVNPNSDGTVNVLDNGYTVNQFADHHHADQIMLMVNIDDTECMGYHNSGCSKQKNDKAALVSWQTIRTWANANGLNGECLNDSWNRSFVGFDFELYSLEDSYIKENGNKVYAKMTDGQNGGLQYVWDGSEVLVKGTAPAESSQDGNDLTSKLDNASAWQSWAGEAVINDNGVYVYEAKAAWRGFDFPVGKNTWVTWDSDWSSYEKLVIEFAEPTAVGGKVCIKNNGADTNYAEFAVGATSVEVTINSNLTQVGQVYLQVYQAGTVKISKVYLVGDAPQVNYYESNYLLVNGQQVPYLSANTNMYAGIKLNVNDSDMKITQNGKECFNMAKIAELVGDGYLPIKDKNLREWVKWQGGDGYFSDWIVTLSQAKRFDDTNPIVKQGRIMCEDLGTIGDFDFNDVVFDAYIHKDGTTDIELWAAGGTLELSVAGEEVHKKFAVTQGKTEGMVNTGITSKPAPVKFTTSEKYYNLIDIPITVRKTDNAGNVTYYQLTAEMGGAPQKICVPIGTKWCDEYVSITKAYPKFKDWVEGENPFNWSWIKTIVEKYTDLNLRNND
ncbi:MAG: hypothetical protein K6G08_06300 [Prevotella sp.]|nr:hypothetical protein [Prevotella sp.]